MRLNADDMLHARRYGRLLWFASLAVAAVFSVGLARRSYWVVAAPAIVIVAGAVSGALLLGRLLMSTPDEPPDPAV